MHFHCLLRSVPFSLSYTLPLAASATTGDSHIVCSLCWLRRGDQLPSKRTRCQTRVKGRDPLVNWTPPGDAKTSYQRSRPTSYKRKRTRKAVAIQKGPQRRGWPPLKNWPSGEDGLRLQIGPRGGKLPQQTGPQRTRKAVAQQIGPASPDFGPRCTVHVLSWLGDPISGLWFESTVHSFTPG